MDEVAMLKALRAKEKKAKLATQKTTSSLECLGTGPVQGDGEKSSPQHQYVASAEKELKKVLVKNKELTEKLKSVEGDMKTVERLKTDLKASETKNTELTAEKVTWDEKYSNMKKAYEDTTAAKKTLEEANKTLAASVTTLTAENKNLVVEKDSLVVELGDTKAEVAMQHTVGFEKAVSQLKFLYPDLKVDEVGPFKHVVDGKLVDIIVDEDEE
ncbi:disease resistance protein RML1A-like [Sesbania bispinosa]|nr:disease resistance protein RML1A-like [Sesbania bispinosa]